MSQAQNNQVEEFFAIRYLLYLLLHYMLMEYFMTDILPDYWYVDIVVWLPPCHGEGFSAAVVQVDAARGSRSCSHKHRSCSRVGTYMSDNAAWMSACVTSGSALWYTNGHCTDEGSESLEDARRFTDY